MDKFEISSTFKGLTLEPETAFRQIAALIEAGLIISVTDANDKSDLSDCVFILAKQYAEAAHNCAVEKIKNPVAMVSDIEDRKLIKDSMGVYDAHLSISEKMKQLEREVAVAEKSYMATKKNNRT